MPPLDPDALLMEATIHYLEMQLLPALSGEHRFKTRLAVNALKILQRGLNEGQNPSAASVTDSAQHWVEKIRQQAVALDDPALLLTLERQLQQSLRINNPKWMKD